MTTTLDPKDLGVGAQVRPGANASAAGVETFVSYVTDNYKLKGVYLPSGHPLTRYHYLAGERYDRPKWVETEFEEDLRHDPKEQTSTG